MTILSSTVLSSINKVMIASQHGAEFRLYYIGADGKPNGFSRTFYTRAALDIFVAAEIRMDKEARAFGPVL